MLKKIHNNRIQLGKGKIAKETEEYQKNKTKLEEEMSQIEIMDLNIVTTIKIFLMNHENLLLAFSTYLDAVDEMFGEHIKFIDKNPEKQFDVDSGNYTDEVKK